jgi:hypothetical protein
MATAKPNTTGKPSSVLHLALGLLLFIVLANVAFWLPHVFTAFVGVYWGALVAVVVFVLWFGFMPTTCMSGGLICSMVAMLVLFNTIGVLLAAAIRFVVSLL